MPYDNLISRLDADSTIPQETSNEILKSVTEKNPLMQWARKLPNMSGAQRRMPVMSALATAYFVSGDTGLKQTTEVNWANKYIDAEELAVIVPIPKAVLDDAKYDLWAEIRPELEIAFARAIFRAVMYGSNIPATWTTNLGGAGLYAGANTAGHVISAAAYTDLYEAILGETGAGVSGLIGLIEEDGFMSTGHFGHLSMRRKLRNVRDADGNPIFLPSMQVRGQYDLDGQPIAFPLDGSMIAANGLLITGQWNQLVYAMRQDITIDVDGSAVIQDAAGTIIYNLFQQDMVALRAVMRLGFALPNPINRVNETEATRFPFAFMTA